MKKSIDMNNYKENFSDNLLKYQGYRTSSTMDTEKLLQILNGMYQVLLAWKGCLNRKPTSVGESVGQRILREDYFNICLIKKGKVNEEHNSPIEEDIIECKNFSSYDFKTAEKREDCLETNK